MIRHALLRTTALSLVLASIMGPVAAAQQNQATSGADFIFAATCDDRLTGTGAFVGSLPAGSSSSTPCVVFTKQDDTTYVTPEVKSGDELSFNLYLHNTNKLPVRRVRIWLAYDPAALTGSSLTMSSSFPKTVAQDTGFFPTEGYIKIGADTDNKEISDEEILIATIKMKALPSASASTVLSFYNLSPLPNSKTAVLIGKGTSEETILTQTQPSLMVRLASAITSSSSSIQSSSAISSAASSAVSSVSSVASASGTVVSSSSSSVAAVISSSSVSSSASVSSVPFILPKARAKSQTSPGAATATMPSTSVTTATNAPIQSDFRRAQVQGLAIDTQRGTVLVAWQPLNQPGVQGYHLYYSSVSGVYTQRRTLTATAAGDVIDTLPDGDTYYFAIRAFDAAGTESDYSREVAVTVGQPGTSTSPLTGSIAASVTGPVPVAYQNQAPLPMPRGTKVAGATGVSDFFNVILCLAAVTGMWAAFRRQLSSTPATV